MSYTVYGLRLIGETEPRYIGMTRRPLAYRVKCHLSYACNRIGKFADWLNDNRELVEAYEIAETADRELAKVIERGIIRTRILNGHQLFNQVHAGPIARRKKRHVSDTQSPPGNRSLGPRGCPVQGASVFAPVGGRAASLARVP